MNRQILAITVATMAVAILATPVLALGPGNAAVNNPNVSLLPFGVGLANPNDIHHAWIYGIDKYVMYKYASDFQINNAYAVTDISEVAENENKWLFFSVEVAAQWMSYTLGVPYPAALTYMQANHPEGMYYKEVFVGK